MWMKDLSEEKRRKNKSRGERWLLLVASSSNQVPSVSLSSFFESVHLLIFIILLLGAIDLRISSIFFFFQKGLGSEKNRIGLGRWVLYYNSKTKMDNQIHHSDYFCFIKNIIYNKFLIKCIQVKDFYIVYIFYRLKYTFGIFTKSFNHILLFLI